MTIRVVEFYKHYFKENSLVNLIKSKNIEYDIFWFFKKRTTKMFLNKREIIIHEFLCCFLLLFNLRSFRNKRIITFGGHFSLFLVSKLFGNILGRDFHLYVRNFYLHSLGEKKAVKAIMHFLLNTKHTTLIVHSPQEMIYFGSLTNNKLYFLPYCEDPIFEMDDSQAPEGDYVFTGGYSNRDYLLLLKCAQNNPTVKFVVAVSRLNKDISGKQIPENITIFEEVDALKFNGLMYKSAGVIIPLKENVGSSGQMLCLGALKMAKAIIYCNISSINYYFDNESSGIPYAIGDIESLNKAVRKLFSEEFDRKALGQAARTHYIENFTLEKSNEQLLDILVSNNFH